MRQSRASATKSEIAAAVKACHAYFLHSGLFSLAINLLYLAPTVYMMQVNDRVLSSGSKETLLVITAALVASLSTLVALDYLRSRLLIRSGLKFDRMLSHRVMQAVIQKANLTKDGKSGEALRHLDGFRQFITGPGVHALFDAPWLPIYLIVTYIIHPVFAVFSTTFIAVQMLIAILTEVMVNNVMKNAVDSAGKTYGLSEAIVRNSEVVQGMGMAGGIMGGWYRGRRDMLRLQATASDRNAALSSLAKFVRLGVQSGILAVGAWLVIDGSITAGGMFAAMLLIGRATQPVEQIIGSWRLIVQARSAYHYLTDLLQAIPEPVPTTMLPEPTGLLTVRELGYTPPGARKPTLMGVDFEVQPGTVLCIVGPSAAGKSSLMRLLVGISPPSAGSVRLDGVDVYNWNREEFGKYVGYLPQDIELFEGTVAQNIARFREGPAEAIIEAAKLSGAYDMILRLPQGFETQIGSDGAILSGGQRQLIGLARAIYGRPKLVVLDEPNSNLDTAGEQSLVNCLNYLRERKTTVIMVTHRTSVLQVVDSVLYVDQGRLAGALPRDELLKRLGGNPGALSKSVVPL